MAMSERDSQSIRLVGGITIGVGMILLILTVLTALFLLLTSDLSDLNAFIHGAIAVMIALIMASTMIGCGTTLSRTKRYTTLDSEALRLNWTALFVVLLASAIANLWLQPVLSVIASAMVLALLAIRSAVIRISSH